MLSLFGIFALYSSLSHAQSISTEPVSIPTQAICQAPPLSWGLKIDFEKALIWQFRGTEVSASEHVKFQKISQFPEVYFDHYRTVYGENNSNFIISLPRIRGLSLDYPSAQGFVLSNDTNQALNCTVSYRRPEDFEKAMTADLIRLQKETQIPESELPPQVCALDYLNEQTADYEFGCSATLIGPQELLTASHCQMIYQNRQARARCPGQEPVAIDLEKSFRHERSLQNIWDLSYDVAVLRLAHSLTTPPLPLVQNVSEARKLLFGASSHCQMFGYGQKVDASSALPKNTLGTLHGTQLHFPPEELGGRSLAETNFENQGLISTDPRLFVRPGDSGGPILCQNTKGENVVVGVHSILLAFDSTANSASVGQTSAWIQSKISQDIPVLAQK